MSLCPHGYTAFYDCPHCEEPMGTKPAARPYVELRELAPGTRFMFYADDLPHRGPCTLEAKNVGSATIEYEPHVVEKAITFRNKKTGAMETKTWKQTLSGRSICSLGAQVIPITPEASRV